MSAARRLFVRDGFERTAIASIAEEADLGFGTFYRYFSDKEAVLRAVAEEVEQDVHSVLAAEDNATGAAPTALARFTRRFAAMVLRNRDVFRLMWQLGMSETGAPRPARQFPLRLGEAIAAIVQRGVSAGDFAGVDVAAYTRFITGAHLALIAPARPGDADLADQLCEFELYALRATGIEDDGGAPA